MVMPRRFSSSSRSASMPVRARTSAVLPWSIWPAVPAIIFLMPFLLMLLLGGALLAQQPAVEKQDEIPVFRAEVNLVKVDAEVVGRDQKNIAELSQQDFQLYDENQLREIAYFGKESEPLDLLLLLDVSGSMRKSLEE